MAAAAAKSLRAVVGAEAKATALTPDNSDVEFAFNASPLVMQVRFVRQPMPNMP